MLEQNKDRYYEIINRGDGVYFARKEALHAVIHCLLHLFWHHSPGGSLWLVEVVWNVVKN